MKFPTDRYNPIRDLGSGGIGKVTLCLDKKLNKEVAIKVLRVATEEQLVAFQTEAKVLAKLHHPNIVSILDFGVTDHGAPYMVLEHVEGTALDRLLAENGPMGESLLVAIAAQIADGLEHAHSTGIFHRDVKTSNVLVSERSDGSPHVHLIDFGIAFLHGNVQQSITIQGKTLVGTPKYMSADQLKGRRFDARSEIYSMGCLMYELLTGRVPFDSEDPLTLLEMHANASVPRFSEIAPSYKIHNSLEQVVLQCLEKDPADRYENMGALHDALSKVQFSASETVTQPENQVTTPFLSSNLARFIGLSVILGLCLAIRVTIVEHRHTSKPSANQPITVSSTLAESSTLFDSLERRSLEQEKVKKKSATADGAKNASSSGSVSENGTALGAFAIGSDTTTMLSEMAYRAAQRGRENPQLRELFAKHPRLDAAFSGDRMARFAKSDVGKMWMSDPQYMQLYAKVKALWGDQKMVDVFDDDGVYAFVKNPKNWSATPQQRIYCPEEFATNTHVQELIEDSRFQRLARDRQFQNLVSDRRFQEGLNDPDDWRMMHVYFLCINSSMPGDPARTKVRPGSNPYSYYVTNPGKAEFDRLLQKRKILSIYLEQFDPSVLKTMPPFPLEMITLDQTDSMKQLNLNYLHRFPRLNCVELIKKSDITQADLSALASIPGLSSIGLCSAKKISKEGLSALRKLPNLNVLILEYNADIDDTSIKQLATLKSLQQLWLSHTRISKRCLADIAKQQSLRFVDLSNTAIKDSELSPLANISALREIKIGSTNRWQPDSQYYDWSSSKVCVELKSHIAGLRFSSRSNADDAGNIVEAKKQMFSGKKKAQGDLDSSGIQENKQKKVELN